MRASIICLRPLAARRVIVATSARRHVRVDMPHAPQRSSTPPTHHAAYPTHPRTTSQRLCQREGNCPTYSHQHMRRGLRLAAAAACFIITRCAWVDVGS
jgi:hypothetical protein